MLFSHLAGIFTDYSTDFDAELGTLKDFMAIIHVDTVANPVFANQEQYLCLKVTEMELDWLLKQGSDCES